MKSKLLNPELLTTLCFLLALGAFPAGIGCICLAFAGWLVGLGSALIALVPGLVALVYLMHPEEEKR